MKRRITGNKVAFRGTNHLFTNVYPIKNGIQFEYSDEVDEKALYSFRNFGALIIPVSIRELFRIGSSIEITETLNGAFVKAANLKSKYNVFSVIPKCYAQIKKANISGYEEIEINNIEQLEKSLKLPKKWNRTKVEVNADESGMFIRFTDDKNKGTVPYKKVREFYGNRLLFYPREKCTYSISKVQEFKLPVFFTDKVGKQNIVLYKNDSEIILTRKAESNKFGYVDPLNMKTRLAFTRK